MSIDDAPSGTPAHAPPAGAEALWDHPLVNRLTRFGQRLKQGDRKRPWLLDAGVVAVAVLLFCVPDLVGGGEWHDPAVVLRHLPWPGTVALQAGLVLPLLWRRRRPSLAFAAITAVFLLQWALGVWLRADVALLIALYSLALHGRLRHLPVACGVAAGALGLVAVRHSREISLFDALFFLFNTIVAAAALGLTVRIRRAQLAGLRDRARRLEIERDQRSRLAAATERARVAREMHDIIGHNLSVIITLADGGAYAAELAPDRSKEALRHIGETGRQAMGELRRMLAVLRERSDAPVLSPQPGMADIDALCARIRAAGPQIVYRSSGNMDLLDRGIQLTVYRIVQEALTNALKHAGHDTRIRLTVTIEDTMVRIGVQDTGPGGDVSGRPWQPHKEGHGLAGMRERAALYQGTVTAGPSSGGGWTVLTTLDLTPPNTAGGTS